MKNSTKKIKYIRKDLKRELWNLICWIGFFKDSKIRIEGVELANYVKELVLINDYINFKFYFKIDDIKKIKGLNYLCCLWANKGKKSSTDYDNKSVFEINLNEIKLPKQNRISP